MGYISNAYAVRSCRTSLPVIATALAFSSLLVCFASAAPEAPTNFRVLQLGPEPTRIAFTWDTAGSAAKYRIYLGDRIEGESTNTSFSHSVLLPDTSYSFDLKAVDAAGVESDPVSLDVKTLPIPTIKPTYKVNTILVRYADFPTAPFTPQVAAEEIHGATGSVNSYYREVSYGKTGIVGDVYGWITLPNNASHYHTRGQQNGLWWGPDTNAIRAAVIDAVPAEALEGVDSIVLFLHGTGDAGYSAGTYKFLSTRGDWGFRLGGVIHELGHGLARASGGARLLHPAGWNCPGADVGPNYYNPTEGGCKAYIYGYEPHDPMGVGTRHFMSYHKWLLGMFEPSNMATADAGATYTLEALEVPGSGIKMLKIPLEENYFYFVEYRKPTGLGGSDLVSGSPGYNSDPIDGILVRLRVGNASSGMSTLLPHDGNSPIVYNPRNSFVDPYRGVEVEVLSKAGNTAQIRVTRFDPQDRVKKLLKKKIAKVKRALKRAKRNGSNKVRKLSRKLKKYKKRLRNL